MLTDLDKRIILIHGQMCQHNWKEIFFLDQILNDERFDRIIELGTADGGLTLIFGLHALRMNIIVDSFDIGREPHDGLWCKLKPLLDVHVQWHRENLFSPEIIDYIRGLMNTGRILLYCDNGNKIREFHTYAPFLKSGDVIMAHDRYSEINISDIIDIVNQYGLEPYYQNEAETIGADILTYRKI